MYRRQAETGSWDQVRANSWLCRKNETRLFPSNGDHNLTVVTCSACRKPNFDKVLLSTFPRTDNSNTRKPGWPHPLLPFQEVLVIFVYHWRIRMTQCGIFFLGLIEDQTLSSHPGLLMVEGFLIILGSRHLWESNGSYGNNTQSAYTSTSNIILYIISGPS